MSNDEVFLDPQVVRQGAGNLTSAAEALSRAWTTFALTAGPLNGAKPWGTDEPGKQFDEQYMGGKAPALSVIDATGTMVTMAGKLGPDVASCVDGTVEVDDLIANWFGGGKQ